MCAAGAHDRRTLLNTIGGPSRPRRNCDRRIGGPGRNKERMGKNVCIIEVLRAIRFRVRLTIAGVLTSHALREFAVRVIDPRQASVGRMVSPSSLRLPSALASCVITDDATSAPKWASNRQLECWGLRVCHRYLDRGSPRPRMTVHRPNTKGC